MKKAKVRRIIVSGIACIILLAVSAWYSITFNDSRLVKPMDASEYSFQIRDMPMLISIILLMLYGVYLFFLLVRAILAEKSRETQMRTTRRINPKYGFFGFFGLFGPIVLTRRFFPLCFSCFLVFSGFSMRGSCPEHLWMNGFGRIR